MERLLRLLFDPTPVEGGNGNTPAPAAPAPAPVGPVVQIPPDFLEEFRALKAIVVGQQTQQQQEAERQRQAEQQRLAGAGRVEELVKTHNLTLEAERQKTAAAEKRLRDSARQTALVTALAGVPNLVEGGVEQLVKLWGDDFEVADTPAGPVVRAAADLRDPAAVVRERLADPKWSHYLKPTSQGGNGLSPASTPAPTQTPQGQQQTLTYEQYVMQQWREQQQQRNAGPMWQRSWRDQLVKPD